ncbi:MAG: hypothetical protein HFJ19_06165 [Clostridia bacterium]|nr:hypothetical protein [Clostridia bacterium]
MSEEPLKSFKMERPIIDKTIINRTVRNNFNIKLELILKLHINIENSF